MEKFIQQPNETSLSQNEYQLAQEKPKKKIPPNPYFDSPFNSTMSSNHPQQGNQSLHQIKEKPKFYEVNSNRGENGKNHNYQNKSQKYREKF